MGHYLIACGVELFNFRYDGLATVCAVQYDVGASLNCRLKNSGLYKLPLFKKPQVAVGGI
jgi:hypothetical protein